MPDERRIVIELKPVDGKGNDSSKDKSYSLRDFLEDIQHPVKSLEKATLGKNVLIYRTYQQGKELIKNAATFQLQKYFNLTENYKAEQTLENALNVISNVSSIGTSIIGGALAGLSVGHPVLGGVIGAGFAIGNQMLNTWKTYDQQNRQITTSNLQSAFQKTKLGLVDDGRGTLN